MSSVDEDDLHLTCIRGPNHGKAEMKSEMRWMGLLFGCQGILKRATCSRFKLDARLPLDLGSVLDLISLAVSSG